MFRIRKIVLPIGLESIASYTFANCENLTSIVIPNSVISIGDNTFNGCVSLADIVVPDKKPKLGDSIFYGCSAIASVKGNTIDYPTYISKSLPNNCVFMKETFPSLLSDNMIEKKSNGTYIRLAAEKGI